MKIDFARQARAAGVNKDEVVMTAIEPTTAQVNDLARLYLEVVQVWANAKDAIVAEYSRSLSEMQTDSPADVDQLIRTTADTANHTITSSFTAGMQAWLTRFQSWHMRKFIDKLRYASGVDLTNQLFAADVAPTIEDVLLRNVALVRSVSDQTRARIADIVFRGFQERKPARKVSKELTDALGMSRRRSLRIASDQTTKLSATLDRDRQQQLGASGFQWQSSGKKHFRPEHKARDGKYYAWDSSVARTDPPGQAINCGCKARAVFKLK